MSYIVIDGRLVKTKTGKANLKFKTINPTPMSLKGVYGKNCNVTRCQKPGAVFYNFGSRAYYCRSCAEAINYEGCRRYGEPDICYLAIQRNSTVSNALEIGWIGDTVLNGMDGKLGVVVSLEEENENVTKLLYAQVVMLLESTFMFVLERKASENQIHRAAHARMLAKAEAQNIAVLGS